MKLNQFDIAPQADEQVRSHRRVQCDLQGQLHELCQTRKQVHLDAQAQSLESPRSPWQPQSPSQAESNEQRQSSAQSRLPYFPPIFLHSQQPSTFTFTNHDFLSSNDSLVRSNLNSAGVPFVSAILSPDFTLDQASNEGTLFGRSLAYLITDTVNMLNAYWPIIGITNAEDFETEDSFCEGMERLFEFAAGLRGNEVWMNLGWNDAVYFAFWGGVRSGYEGRKDRRA